MSSEQPQHNKKSFSRFSKCLSRDALAAGAVAGMIGLLYLCTLLPGIHGWGDVTKAQFLGRVLGIGHATGYPVYILLTHLWSYLPLGELAWRINFFSAVCAAGTCVFLYLTVRLLGGGRLSAVFAGLLLGVTPTLWSQAVNAEVYTLNSLFFSAVIHSVLLWQADRRMFHLYRAVILYALALGDHMTIVFLFPAVAFFVIREKPSILRDARFIVFSVSCAVLVFSLYPLYLFWRSNAHSVFLENRFTQWDQVLDFMTGGPFKGKMFHSPLKVLLGDSVPQRLSFFVSEFNLFILPILAGFYRLKAPRVRIFLILIAVTYFIWNLNYNIFDIRIYFIPVFYLAALFAGFGFELFLERLKTSWARVLGCVLVLGGIGMLVFLNFETSDQSKNTELHKKIRSVIDRQKKDTLFAVYFGPDYGVQMGFYYFLEGLGEGKKRNMAVSGYLSGEQIYSYVTSGSELRDTHTGQKIPQGLNVIASGVMVDDLMRYGLLAKPLKDDFFEMKTNPLQAAVQSEGGDLLFPNSDFEAGTLSNWQANGEAFNFQPTLGNNPTFRERPEGSFPQGQYWIGTYERRHKFEDTLGEIQGDGPTGALLSTSFVIREDMIKFKIGGGNGTNKMAVVLRVGNKAVLTEMSWGMQLNTERMHDVLWDVRPWKGMRATIEVRDWESGHWGHINVDDFRYARVPRKARSQT